MRLKKRLTPFVTPLPVPKILKPMDRNQKYTFYIVQMREASHQFHRDLPPARIWGYEGITPGPTIEAERNEQVRILWLNQLPKRHLLPVDKTIYGTPSTPESRTVVHIHGAVAPSDSDGHPEAWYTKGFQTTGPKFQRRIYLYPNRQRAATLWYHDHAMGITRLNVYAGLAGFYLIRDKNERSLPIPKGKYEIPLLIQDRSFNQDGSLFYPRRPANSSSRLPNPSIVPEFFGDTIVVNGKVWPYLNVEPRKYRFRLLNGSNSRFYTLSLSSGQSFIQIGTDGGLFRSPVLVKSLTLAPAERADVILDFSKFKGEKIALINSAPTPFPNGSRPDPQTTGLVMQFRVKKQLSRPDTSSIPRRLSVIPATPLKRVTKVRNISWNANTDRFGRLMMLLQNKKWHDPINIKPRLGSLELWQLINSGPNTHPIHLHEVNFRVLNRQPFDRNYFRQTGKLRFTGPPIPPARNESGLKDIVMVHPGLVTRIIPRFSNAFPGIFSWHCHILEHEDWEMMRPFLIVRHSPKTSRQ